MAYEVKEYLLTINEFNEPKELNGASAVQMLIVRLLLLTPGTFPEHPLAGVGLISKWRFCDASEIINLQFEIYNQISQYLPIFSALEVNLSTDVNSKELYIDITMDDSIYRFQTDMDNNTILSLSDL